MVSSFSISNYLNKEHFGKELDINYFSELSNIKENTIVFAKKFSESFVDTLNQNPNVLAIVTKEYKDKIKCSYVISENPRLDFIRILSRFFVSENPNKGKIHPTAIIEKGAQIGKNVTIGANVYISSQTIIGDNTIIHPNVVIDNKVSIGENCEIKSGAVIGQSGFGFERDELGFPIYFPHLGEIMIGNYVNIGANTAIDRATIGKTIISDGVKVDNLVHIAHNDVIGENTIITAGVIFSGGVIVGKNAWIAPSVSIKEKTKIEDNAFIGLGAVVIKDVENGSVIIGNPGKKLIK